MRAKVLYTYYIIFEEGVIVHFNDILGGPVKVAEVDLIFRNFYNTVTATQQISSWLFPTKLTFCNHNTLSSRTSQDPRGPKT